MAIFKRPVLLAPLLVGCYTYSPIAPAAAPEGSEVRAHINGAAMDRIGPQLGSINIREVTGNVVENKQGQLVLEVPIGALPSTGEAVIPLHQRISLAPADMVSLETRAIDRRRTIIAGAAVVAGATALAVIALNHGGGGTPSGTQEPPGVNRIPVLRFRF